MTKNRAKSCQLSSSSHTTKHTNKSYEHFAGKPCFRHFFYNNSELSVHTSDIVSKSVNMFLLCGQSCQFESNPIYPIQKKTTLLYIYMYLIGSLDSIKVLENAHNFPVQECMFV